MPIYEYHCSHCDNICEKLRRYDNSETTTCPNCGKDADKILSACHAKFLGTGFYETDYKGSVNE